jgi:uncharacterized protein (TIGR02147 family)
MIFNFNNYKAFLKDYIHSLPQKGRGQVNKIAQHLEVNSTLVSQVLGDHKDFSYEQGFALCEYLGLKDAETDYFMLLLQFEKAGTAKLKGHLRAKIHSAQEKSKEIKNRVNVDRTLTDQERAVFYSSWLYSAIRLYCSLGNGKSIDEISDRFLLGREKVSEMLQFLTEAGLCSQEKSLYKMGAQKTHLAQGSPFLARHYSNWRFKAIQRSENIDKIELMYSAPFSVSKKDFEALREEIMKLIQTLQSTVSETTPEDIACINLDLFWIK